MRKKRGVTREALVEGCRSATRREWGSSVSDETWVAFRHSAVNWHALTTDMVWFVGESLMWWVVGWGGVGWGGVGWRGVGQSGARRNHPRSGRTGTHPPIGSA